MFWRFASAALALVLLITPVILVSQGCEETQQVEDGPPPLPDAGGSRACGDVGPYGWAPVVQGEAKGDSGEASTLFAVWGASEKAIWAVGTAGKVLHYDGTEWKSQAVPQNVTLTGVWGTTEKDVWAVGYAGTVFHYDGTGWKDHSPPDTVFVTTDGGVPTGDAGAALRRNLWGVWAAGTVSTDALYAVGDRGLVIYYDGKSKLWSDKIPVTAAGTAVKVQDQLNGVWGTSASKVYIVGNFGTVLEGSKTGLALQKTGITKDLHAVWGRNDNDIYAVGTGGTILHRSGGWKPIGTTTAPKQVFRGVWGPSSMASITYIVGWDGTLLRMSGGPGFSKGAQIDPYYCIVPGRRLEAIWGTEVPITMFDAGAIGPTEDDLGAAVSDMGSNQMVPAVWVVGASGMVIAGP
jgi:hypothetical protein